MSAIEIAGDLADFLHTSDEMIRMAEMPVRIRLWQIFFLYLLAHRVGAAICVVSWVIPVDAAEGGANGCGRKWPIAARGLARHFAGRCQNRVAGGVDEGLGADETKALDVADNRPVDLMTVAVGIDHACEVTDFHTGLDAELV